MRLYTKAKLSILVVLVITILLWTQALWPLDLSVSVFLSTLLGALAVAVYALNFIVAIRHPKIEHWFEGLEKQYATHKIIGITAIILVIMHGMVSKINPRLGETLTVQLGSMAQILSIALIGIALFAKRIQYEHWRIFHRLFIIPFALGVYHSFFSSPVSLFNLNPLSLWMMALSLSGFFASIYMLLIYQRFGFKHRGTLTEVKRLSPKHVELMIKLDQKHDFKPGQFVFMKVVQEGLDNSPHPFSLSGVQVDTLCITIKALGDFTQQLMNEIKPNTRIHFDGPYGTFEYDKAKKQVWFAGGVGITPFIARLRVLEAFQEVELYYSFRGQEEAIYRDLLLQMQAEHPRFNVHFIDSRTNPRLNIRDIVLNGDENVILCGPTNMMQAYAKEIHHRYPNAPIQLEAFSFAD